MEIDAQIEVYNEAENTISELRDQKQSMDRELGKLKTKFIDSES